MRSRLLVSVLATYAAIFACAAMALGPMTVARVAYREAFRLNRELERVLWTVQSWRAEPTALRLDDPSSVYVDGSGRIFVSERRGHRIWVLADGEAHTFAGIGRPGYSGDGGRATRAALRFPEGLAGDRDGNLYVADSRNNRIRRVSTDGSITTIAGTGTAGYAGDGDPAVGADLRGPFDVAVTADAVIYIADTENHCIRRIGRDGVITTVAGTGEPGYSGDGGPASEAMLNMPYGIALDESGALYIADSENHRVRRVLKDGTIETIAGTGVMGFGGDGGAATLAQFNSPQELFITSHHEIYVVDEHNNRIRKIDATGTITTVAGTGVGGYGQDGEKAAEASLSDPESIWVYPSGEFLIADGDNNVIRRVGASGILSTVLGAAWVRDS